VQTRSHGGHKDAGHNQQHAELVLCCHALCCHFVLSHEADVIFNFETTILAETNRVLSPNSLLAALRMRDDGTCCAEDHHAFVQVKIINKIAPCSDIISLRRVPCGVSNCRCLVLTAGLQFGMQ